MNVLGRKSDRQSDTAPKLQRRTGRLRAGIITALILVPAVVACTTGGGLRTLNAVIDGGAFPLPPAAQKQVERFEKVYRTYSREPATKPFQQFNDALRRVRATYVEPVSDRVLIDNAIAGVETLKGKIGTFDPNDVVEAALDNMLASLDPHSGYLNAEAFRESRASTSGEFGGLGVEITFDGGLIRVVAPIEGTPAEAAGLLSGDVITRVNGEAIRGKGLANAVNLMRGKPGSTVTITIARGDAKPFDVKIVRDVIRVRSVRWRAIGTVGYVRVARFTEQVEPGIAQAMNELHRDLGAKLSGIVLDLRNNPGGLLDQSLILADAFLDKGRVVEIRGRSGTGDRIHTASPGDMAEGLPMVILINGGSASASEIVAGALQENHRAIVMGRRSFGKGSVQTITPLPIEGAIRLTTARYYSPQGHAIQGNGIYPDILLKLPKNESKGQVTHESDLPHALKATEKPWHTDVPAVEESRCVKPGAKPLTMPSGDPDMELTCAIRFLKTGSIDKFVTEIDAEPSS